MRDMMRPPPWKKTSKARFEQRMQEPVPVRERLQPRAQIKPKQP